MQTKTITTTVEVPIPETIVFPVYAKDESSFYKIINKHAGIRVVLRKNGVEISTQEFYGSTVTASSYDFLLAGAIHLCTEKEFEDACIEAIAKIQSITLDN